jgi:hypothetical protein
MRRSSLFLLIVHLAASVAAANASTDQLERFMQSRPGTSDVLNAGPEISRFLHLAFSGVYTSVPLVWDPGEPQGNAYAENIPGNDKKAIIIRVSSALVPLDQVAALVYECLNAQNEHFFAELSRKAHLGFLTKDDFIAGILRLEHRSLKEARAFLSRLEPYRDMDDRGTEFYRKMIGIPEEFDPFLQYLCRIRRPDFDIFSVYSQFYDFIIIASPGNRTVTRIDSPCP